MRIDEAIEALNGLVWNGTAAWSTNTAKATLLGIEALDDILRARRANPGVAYTVLRGETEQ